MKKVIVLLVLIFSIHFVKADEINFSEFLDLGCGNSVTVSEELEIDFWVKIEDFNNLGYNASSGGTSDLEKTHVKGKLLIDASAKLCYDSAIYYYVQDKIYAGGAVNYYFGFDESIFWKDFVYELTDKPISINYYYMRNGVKDSKSIGISMENLNDSIIIKYNDKDLSWKEFKNDIENEGKKEISKYLMKGLNLNNATNVVMSFPDSNSYNNNAKLNVGTFECKYPSGTPNDVWEMGISSKVIKSCDFIIPDAYINYKNGRISYGDISDNDYVKILDLRDSDYFYVEEDENLKVNNSTDGSLENQNFYFVPLLWPSGETFDISFDYSFGLHGKIGSKQNRKVTTSIVVEQKLYDDNGKYKEVYYKPINVFSFDDQDYLSNITIFNNWNRWLYKENKINKSNQNRVKNSYDYLDYVVKFNSLKDLGDYSSWDYSNWNEINKNGKSSFVDKYFDTLVSPGDYRYCKIGWFGSSCDKVRGGS